MGTNTNNHGFGKPTLDGDTDVWGEILNQETIDKLEERVLLVDLKANRTNYTAYTDSVFLASDTSEVYLGDGTNWNESDLVITSDLADVSNSGTLVVNNVDDLNFGDDLAVTDDGDNTVTIALGENIDVTTLTASTSISTPLTDTDEVQNKDYNEAVNTIADASSTTDLDLSLANAHEVAAIGNVTFTFSNVTGTPPGNSMIVYVEDSDGLGPYTLSWPTSVVWSNGNAITEVAANSDVEITLWTPDGGTTWRARKSGEAFA